MGPECLLRVHKRPQMFPILSQMNPVHIFQPHFPAICFKITVPSAPWSSHSAFTKKMYAYLPMPCALYVPPVSL
jgi:hypothetical protein